MTVEGRRDLAAIPPYNIPTQRPEAVLLNSNEWPGPPSAAVQQAIRDAAARGNRYPAWSSDELVARLAEHHDLDPGWISVGCGSVSLCQQVVQATCGPLDEVIHAWRSFEAYPVVARVHGAVATEVPLTRYHVHDLDAMAAAVTERTRLIFVCNPNNPTGTAVRTVELTRFLDRVPAHVLVVLDEAYREFVTDPDVPDGIPLALERDNVAVLRTFSKAYGLAGIRVGYCVAPPSVTGVVAKVAIPFAVSRTAQAAALAALGETRESSTACRRVTAERDRVHGELRALGYEVSPSQANFHWLPLGSVSAAFGAHCEKESVLVRVFGTEGVRVTVGSPAENDLLLSAARTFPLTDSHR
ncbi:histidinol-phosphate transaminase [Streptomyces sp. H39-S7]|uniref:histidinol-phosphate transaminase n=1 Tax=Streptomyces sp. H39-S7 TaxID=3004357 RepID=UPI0022AE832A|nr:histidinol-phosphate transaminase [Streptomyces sp. H39-S7]MCZ4125216.1 histidinol-phosphate transaminase [Streptomyces sp. H39-S7]